MPGAHHARDVAEEHADEHERGQQQVLELRSRMSAPSGQRAETGSQPSTMPKTTIATQRRDELGHDRQREAADADDAIRRPVGLERRDRGRPMNASGIISTNAKSASLADLGRARARIELTDSPEVYDLPKSPRTAWLAQSRYCVVGRAVEAALLVERVDRLLRGEAAEHVAPDVARQHLPEREHDHAQKDERHERERETAGQEHQHRGGDSLTERWSSGRSEETPTAAAQCAAAVGPSSCESLRRATSCSGRSGRAGRP